MGTEPVRDGRLAGVDFGDVRIGVALTDRDRTIASPHQTYTRGDADADARYFRRLAEREQVVRWIVGLPVHSSGEESEKSRQARRFGRWLAETTGIEVTFFDERFTSVQAEELLTGAKLTRKKRKARRDMLAAQIMLRAYLESPRRSTDEPGPLDD